MPGWRELDVDQRPVVVAVSFRLGPADGCCHAYLGRRCANSSGRNVPAGGGDAAVADVVAQFLAHRCRHPTALGPGCVVRSSGGTSPTCSAMVQRSSESRPSTSFFARRRISTRA